MNEPAKPKADDIPDGCVWWSVGIAVVMIGIPAAGALAIVVLLWRWAIGW